MYRTIPLASSCQHAWPDFTRINIGPSKSELTPLLLSDKQVATLLGCHRNTIWNRVRKEMIATYKMGRQDRVASL
jgi:hypothetical protein